MGGMTCIPERASGNQRCQWVSAQHPVLGLEAAASSSSGSLCFTFTSDAPGKHTRMFLFKRMAELNGPWWQSVPCSPGHGLHKVFFWHGETGGQLPGQPPRSRWEPWRLLSQGQPQCLTFPKGAPHLGDLAVGAEALAPN